MSDRPEADPGVVPEVDDSDVAGDSATEPDPPRTGKPPKLPGRDPIWAYVLIVFGSVLSVAAATIIGGSEVLAHRYESTIERRTLIAPEARTDGSSRSNPLAGPLNYLLLGSDSRDSTPELREARPEAGERSDTIIIVHIPATHDRAYLISVPRDLRVQIPAFKPTRYRGGLEKINGAFQHGGGGEGGVQLLSQTLTNLIGIRFAGAAIIDFSGLRKVVEQLGGVDMCVDVRTVSHHIGFDDKGRQVPPFYGQELEHRNPASNPVVYEVGCRRFEGWQALDYVRQRKSLPDGDYGRQRHQQQFLRAVFEKAQASGISTNPLAADRFMRAIGDSLTVDIGGVAIDNMLYELRDIRPDRLFGVKLPSEPQTIDEISYVVGLPDAGPLYAAIRGDTVGAWAAGNPQWLNQV